ncbi:prepilin-type N-terminal cleavage/methylation domain-containing protein [Actinoplanes sp. NPDC051861]|uniref:prepilin-type N-terminal cleavage/methylation domain-containing protein n=1 Tax=Actinoplanes sp. NPDC051861 TaxID=3155170 RepID=UPI0034324CDB
MQDVINRLRNKKDDEGFTLIELLVVVVIIGVLVAIAVPVYLNYRKGAADKSAQSDVRGAISAIEQFYTSNNNQYPANANVDNGDGTHTTMDLPVLAAGGTAGTVTISDKTVLRYVLVPATGTVSTYYKVCAHNTGGTDGKYFLYNSLKGGSVKEDGTLTSTNFGTCGA